MNNYFKYSPLLSKCKQGTLYYTYFLFLFLLFSFFSFLSFFFLPSLSLFLFLSSYFFFSFLFSNSKSKYSNGTDASVSYFELFKNLQFLLTNFSFLIEHSDDAGYFHIFYYYYFISFVYLIMIIV